MRASLQQRSLFPAVAILSAASMVFFLGGATAGVQAPWHPKRPAGVPEEYVTTPNGYFHPSCVRQLAEGDVLLVDEGIIRHSDGSAESCPVCNYAHYTANGEAVAPGLPAPGQALSSRAADAVTPASIPGQAVINQAYTSTTTSYGQIVATWVVPSAPTSNDGQTLYFWPGLEPTDQSIVLQPILGWFYGSWWIFGANCCPGGVNYTSPLLNVNPGDQIQGTVQANCPPGTLNCGSWNVIAQDLTAGTSSLLSTSNSGPPMSYAYAGVTETYNIAQCSDFPPNGSMTFNAALYDNNFNLISNPGWRTPILWSSFTPQCNYGASVSGLQCYGAPLPGTQVTLSQSPSSTPTFNIDPISTTAPKGYAVQIGIYYNGAADNVLVYDYTGALYTYFTSGGFNVAIVNASWTRGVTRTFTVKIKYSGTVVARGSFTVTTF
jgi:hypothetical protein